MVLHIPLWIYLLDIIILAVVILLLFSAFIMKRRIHRKIRTALDTWREGTEPPVITLPQRSLLFYADYIEKLSRLYGQNLPLLTGLDELWLKKLKTRPTRKTMLRLLKYVPEKSLFDVFSAVLAKKNLEKSFLRWIETSGEFMILKKIALSGNGKSFNGKKAALFFKNEIETLIEMTSDPLWQCRYFAVSILVHDPSNKGDNVLRKSFYDSHSIVREVLINTYTSTDREFLYTKLLDCFLNDPVFTVRRNAKNRIDREFEDLYTVQPEDLSPVQKLHLVELLHTDSVNDENIGMSFLKSGSRELELYASRYLSRTGSLSRLLKNANPGDAENFDRSYRLLRTAVQSNCADFLKEITQTDNPGSLLLASRFLKEDGSRLLITPLLEKAAALYRETPHSPLIKEIYTNALVCACQRGNDKALLKVSEELVKQKYSRGIQEFLLPELPERGDALFTPLLLEFLKDPDYETLDRLIAALIRFSTSSVIPELITIIRSDDTLCPAEIKKRALHVLGKTEAEHGIQYILENLPLFSLKEAKELTKILIHHTPEYFDERAQQLLSSHDSGIRSRLIAALPEDHKKKFIPSILSALKDSDPEVRISCVWALVLYRDKKLLKECVPLLHDPVESVREETAKAVSLHGGKEGIAHIQKILFDKTASSSVKRAILTGLGNAGTDDAFALLTAKLQEPCELPDEMVSALVNVKTETRIKTLFELLDSVPRSTQPILRKALTILGPETEKTAIALLLEKNTALKDYAAEMLEKSGFVDRTVRVLGHRDPEERYRAAELLSSIGTKKAYRGLLAAAKDPVEKIRITVIKAVDRLNTREGKALLEELKNDPDRKVRRYTLWALERAEAKALPERTEQKNS